MRPWKAATPAAWCSVSAEPIRLCRSARARERRAMDGPERTNVSGEVVDLGSPAVDGELHRRAVGSRVEGDFVDQGANERDAETPLEVESLGIGDRRVLGQRLRIEPGAPVVDH